MQQRHLRARGFEHPHHGGAVLMLRDLHYEIVFEPTGRVVVYFSALEPILAQ